MIIDARSCQEECIVKSMKEDVMRIDGQSERKIQRLRDESRGTSFLRMKSRREKFAQVIKSHEWGALMHTRCVPGKRKKGLGNVVYRGQRGGESRGKGEGQRVEGREGMGKGDDEWSRTGGRGHRDARGGARYQERWDGYGNGETGMQWGGYISGVLRMEVFYML